MFGGEASDKKVKVLSGGERTRLAMIKLLLEPVNFLILDEPTNHLDIESREALIEALEQYRGTMLVVAHDRYLLSEVVDEIWELQTDRIQIYQCGFNEYYARKKEQEANEIERNGATRVVRQGQKVRKREQAEVRNKIYQQIRPLKKRFEVLEKELETNLAEQDAVEIQLADPSTYADNTLSREIGQRFAALQQRAEEIMSDLAYLEKEIQDLELKRSDNG